MSKVLTALFLGDVIGQPGCRALFIGLKGLVKNHKADLVVVNGENAADGFGITPELATTFFNNGVDVITTGNHVWQRKEIYPILDSNPHILRPANYPSQAPGKGYTTISIKGTPVGILNLQGRRDMGPLNCPFQTARDVLKKEKQGTRVILIDFHAESAEEKEALALYLDGQVSAVVGTHTHIQTSDERILPGGCGYITDLGMTGPELSVIGSDSEMAIRRSLTQMPLKIDISNGPAVLSGVVLKIDVDTGKTVSIERFQNPLGV
jgi:hypothetical protein